MKASVLGSSSRGNSILISDDDTNILIDSGLSLRHTVKNLKAVGSTLDSIDAVLVTHSHTDHVRSLSQVGKGKKIVSTPGTLRVLEGTLENDGYNRLALDYGESTNIGTMKVKSFPVPHDCHGQPSGFVVESGNKKVGVAMDLGLITDEVVRNLKGCNGLIIESNHDPEMLFRSRRPPWLISRILGPKGHLSNAECADALDRVMDSKTEWVLLTHLSQECNRPDKALSEVKELAKDNDTELQIAHPTLPTTTQMGVGNEGTN